MELYKIEEYTSKLLLFEKLNIIKNLLSENDFKIGYLLFTCKDEKEPEVTEQAKIKSGTGMKESCRFITYPYFGGKKYGLQIIEPEKMLANINQISKRWFSAFESLIFGGISSIADDSDIVVVTNETGLFDNSISFNLHYYKDYIKYVYRLPAENDGFVSLRERLSSSEYLRFSNHFTISKLTVEEKKLPVCIPELKNSERYKGIFRFDPNKNYRTDEKPRTSLKKALDKTKIPDGYVVDISGCEAILRYRSKENHIIRAMLESSNVGSAGWRGYMIYPVATFNVTYAGVNFRQNICSRFCHKTSQAVLNDFVNECMQLLSELTEEVNRFDSAVTALPTPSYFVF